MPSQYTTKTLYVPIDIGKNVNLYAGYAGEPLAVVSAARKVATTRAGYETFKQWVERQLGSGRYEGVVVGHEPTGIYHERWAYQIAADFGPRVDYRFVNPMAVKQRRVGLLNGRHRKSDPLDLEAIAHCLRDGQGQRAFLPSGDELRLKVWVSAFRQTQHEQRRLAVHLLRLLDRLWPGLLVNVARFRRRHPDLKAPVPLLLSHPLERQTLRALIAQAPNPYEWLTRSQEELIAFFRKHVGRGGPKTAATLQAIIQAALLPPEEVAEVLAATLQADFARYRQLEARLADLQQQAETLVPTSPAAVLVTIPGLSPFLAARYLAGLGHHQRFTTAEEVWDFAGFGPDERRSGDRCLIGHISKKGSPTLRDTLFLIGQHTARHCPPIQRAFERAKARGLRTVGATIHVAHKANRLCFRLLSDQVPFDPEHYR